MVLLFEKRFQQAHEGVLHVHLDVAEFFVTFVLKNLTEQGDIVILSQISLNAVDDGGHPLDDQTLQAVSLVQISIHKLLHSFSWQFGIFTLLIVFHLLRVYIVDDVFQLFQRENSLLRLTHSS